MEGNRRRSFKKRGPSRDFKRGGSSNKRGRFSEQSSENSQTSETVYRILCPSRKIGSVLGKGGGIVKALREETQAKITVADSVPGSEERVITIYSPSTKLPIKNDIGNNDMELHCAAQHALLKVHDNIVEEDIIEGTDDVVTARLLVPNNTVGCLLGKKGDVITRLRSETGATIRVMPAEQVPELAMGTDVLVQISAIPGITKRALHEVSTLLHQNPRKDKPPSGGGQGSRRPGPPIDNRPPMNFMRPERGSNPRGAPQMPWMGGYNSGPSRFGHDGFNGDRAPAYVDDTPGEFAMKLICSAAKIGGVIGHNGANVRQLQQGTGTTIHVDDGSVDADLRVIRVSAFETLRNPRSQTIDAVLFLQERTSEHNEKGMISMRLLIPSSKVGCIIGQGGQIINEMRRRTQADIRVFPKEEKPKCADDDEELVQVSGSYGVAREALAEIASRFRARILRDVRPGAEPAPVPGFMPVANFVIQVPPSVAYDPFKGGGREYEPVSYPAPPSGYEPRTYVPPPSQYDPHGYPVPPTAQTAPTAPTAPGYPGAVDPNMPNSGQVSGMVPGTHNINEVPGTIPNPQDPYTVGAEPVHEMHNPTATHGVDIYQGYGPPAGQNPPPQHSYYDHYPTQQPPYLDMNSAQYPQYQTTTTAAPTAAATVAATTATAAATTTDPYYQSYPPQQGHYPEASYQYGQ